MIGNNKNKPTPEARCKIETNALMGNLMVNKFKFLGLLTGRFFCILILSQPLLLLMTLVLEDAYQAV
jgi:hypothetical protein